MIHHVAGILAINRGVPYRFTPVRGSHSSGRQLESPCCFMEYQHSMYRAVRCHFGISIQHRHLRNKYVCMYRSV